MTFVVKHKSGRSYQTDTWSIRRSIMDRRDAYADLLRAMSSVMDQLVAEIDDSLTVQIEFLIRNAESIEIVED